MKIIIILAVIFAIATTIYRRASKTKVTNRTDDSNNPRATLEHSSRTVSLLTTNDWKLKFRNAGLEQHWAKFEHLLRNEIAIHPDAAVDTEIKVGQSKIGGQPDLPRNQTWFKEDNGTSLGFLAQINLTETRPFDKSNQLPPSGLLYFFYSAEQDAWGFDLNDKDKFKVFYFNGDISDLERPDFPSDLPEHSRYKTCKLTFAHSVSAPSWESGVVRGLLTSEEQDAYVDLTVDGEITKLLGHSDNIQAPMETNAS